MKLLKTHLELLCATNSSSLLYYYFIIEHISYRANSLMTQTQYYLFSIIADLNAVVSRPVALLSLSGSISPAPLALFQSVSVLFLDWVPFTIIWFLFWISWQLFPCGFTLKFFPLSSAVPRSLLFYLRWSLNPSVCLCILSRPSLFAQDTPASSSRSYS